MSMHLMHTDREEDFFTPQQVAALLPNTSADTVRRWIRNGELEAVKNLSGRYLVPRRALSQVLKPAAPAGSAPASSSASSSGGGLR